MRRLYIRKVKKELSCSNKIKKEILRDLNEIFDSAVEHEETESQVIERLGKAEEYARECNQQYETAPLFKNRKQRIITITLAILSCLFLIIAFSAHLTKVPANVIGQADASTGIYVHSNFPFDSFYVYLFIGLLCGFLSMGIILKPKFKK